MADTRVQTLQFTTLFLVHLTWGWGVIGCAIASAVRGDPSPQRISRYSQRYAGTNLSQADLQQRLVFDGLYLDSKSSVVFGVFLGVAIGCLAWLRITDAPKFALPSVLASILAIIVCSYGALIPTFHQSALLGTYFSYPSLTYAAVAITVSAVVFPESVQHKFLSGLASTLDGIQKVTAQQYPMLSTPPSSDEFTKFKVTSEIRADAAIKYQSVLMLKANLTREFSYSKWSGNDCKTIEACVRRLLLRAGGLQVFYDSIRTWQDRYRRNVEDQEGEKAKQALHEDQVEDDGDAAGQRTRSVDSSDTPTPLSSIHSPGVTESREQPDLEKQEHHTSRHHLSNHPLDLLKKSLHNQHQQHHHSHHGSKVKPVGIFETLTRANLEGRMLNPLDREWLNDTCQRLGPASQRLLEACESSINASSRTIRQTNKQRVWTALGIHFDLATYTTGLLGHEETSGSAAPKWSPATLKTTHEELKAALEEFRTTKRHAVIDPYRPYFEKLEQLQKDDATELTLESLEPPPHRALFYCLLFEFQLCASN